MEVSEQIIQVIKILCEKFGIAFDWSISNILPYIQQLSEKIIRYEINTSITWIVIGTIILIIGIICFIFIFKNKCSEGICFVLFLIGTTCTISGILVTATNIFDIIQATSFPEKTIWELINSYNNNYNR